MPNRPYQDEALVASRDAFDKELRRQLLIMATGTGKTRVFAQLPEKFPDLPGQFVVVAHREELIRQAIEDLREMNPGKRVGEERADNHCDPSLDDIIVASVGSLHERRRAKFNWPRVDKFTIDEAHHVAADSYQALLEAAGYLGDAYRPSDARLLVGCTATPQRGDGQGLGDTFNTIVYTYTIRQAIEEGWLVDIRGYKVRTNTDLTKVKIVDGSDMLADAVDTPQRNQIAVLSWKKYAEDKQTIGFCVNIEHARHAAELFNFYDVKAEYTWGTDPDRAMKIAMFREGACKALFNCDVLTEGFDMWQVGCVLQMAPTKSPVRYVQTVGRATRLQKGTGNLLKAHKDFVDNCDFPSRPWFKYDCIVIDLVDNTRRNTLITLPTLMGMNPNLNLEGKSMLWAAKQIEKVLEEYPHLNLEALEDISGLETFVEEVSLFDPKFSEAVEANSDMSWFTTPTGYVLNLPKIKTDGKPLEQGKLRIEQNLLDKYEIFGTIRNRKYRGQRGTIEDAFKAADDLLRKLVPDVDKVCRRVQHWHKDPASPGQLKALKKLFKGKQIPPDIDKGTASRLISSKQAGRV